MYILRKCKYKNEIMAGRAWKNDETSYVVTSYQLKYIIVLFPFLLVIYVPIPILFSITYLVIWLFGCSTLVPVLVNKNVIGYGWVDYTDYTIFSERTTLRSLYAISGPSVVCCLSVCCLSVTLVHPTQAVELFGNFFSPYDSSGTLLFWCQKSLVGDAPFPLKFSFKVTDPL